MLWTLIATHLPAEGGKGLPITIRSFPALEIFPEFKDLFTTIANFLFIFAFIVAFAYLLYGGFRLITAGGEERAVADARETITYAIVGVVVVFLAFLLVRLVQGVTGVQIFNSNF